LEYPAGNRIVESVTLHREKISLYSRPAVSDKGAAKKWQKQKRGKNPRLLEKSEDLQVTLSTILLPAGYSKTATNSGRNA
jgi:hypothetical protein